MLIVLRALAGCDPVTRPAATQPATRASNSQVTVDAPHELPAGDTVFSRNLQRPGRETHVKI